MGVSKSARSVFSPIISAIMGTLAAGAFLFFWAGSPLKSVFRPELAAEGSARRTYVVDVVSRVSPAVVNIGTEQVVQRKASPFYPYSTDPSLDEFYRDFFEPNQMRKQVRHSLGSGVIIDPDGHVLTNEHVILRASKITVILVDGRELQADLIGADSESDLAVLKIKSGEKLPFLSMGNSGNIMVGEPAIAIGNPFGLNNTVTTGVISATERSIQTPDRVYHDFLQTDASINPGNSGGPLINADGELIGINTAIYQKAQGIGFAIPINMARRIVNDLLRYGEVHVGWLGFDIKDLTTLDMRKLGYQGRGGVLVGAVIKNGPADQAGIKSDDIIESINGAGIRSSIDYKTKVRRLGVGESVLLKLYRKGRIYEITVKAGEFPLDLAEEVGREGLGISVGPAPAGIKALTLTSVMPGSAAHRAGLKAGDLLLRVNDDVVTNMEEYKHAMAKSRVLDNVSLLIRRGPSIFYVTLQMRQ